MSKQKLISVVIPTYNESKNILLLTEALVKELASYQFEIIIVDDHSNDGTKLTLQKIIEKDKRIKFYLNPPPRGLSKSILMGINKSKGDIIVGMDADFNHDPQKITKLVEEIDKSNLDMVVASRFINGGGMDDRFRLFFTFIFNLILRIFFAFPLTDNASGYYAIKSTFLKKMPLKKIYLGYGEYHLRLVYLAKTLNLKIKEIPVFYQKRKYGVSKSRLLHMFFTYIKVAWQMRFN